MGHRGPLRNPNSRRGIAEAKKAQLLADLTEIGKAPTPIRRLPAPVEETVGDAICPSWLSKEGREIWHQLVLDLESAGVVIKQVDAHAVAMAADCLSEIADWGERKKAPGLSLTAHLNISAIIQKNRAAVASWLDKIGGTPSGRARLPVKATPKKAGPLARILAAKQGQRGP
jgi:phage terminase small subunit